MSTHKYKNSFTFTNMKRLQRVNSSLQDLNIMAGLASNTRGYDGLTSNTEIHNSSNYLFIWLQSEKRGIQNH